MIHPIVKDIFFKNIDTFLHEIFRRKGEMKWVHWKGWRINTLIEESPSSRGSTTFQKTIFDKKMFEIDWPHEWT
jgi:hypothetical protein